MFANIRDQHTGKMKVGVMVANSPVFAQMLNKDFINAEKSKLFIQNFKSPCSFYFFFFKIINRT